MLIAFSIRFNLVTISVLVGLVVVMSVNAVRVNAVLPKFVVYNW